MLDPVYSEPTKADIIERLEVMSKLYFKRDLGHYLQDLEANRIPEEKEALVERMQTWLRALPKEVIVQLKRHELNITA
jgi:hypothetical protein